MTKKAILVIAIVVVICLALVGCESYKNAKFDMPDTSAAVSSNGGSVVVQGDYIYFINGQAGILDKNVKDNWFGNALKGAILRIKTTETDMSKAEVVVPKTAYSTASNSGFSIYGDYIYYVSPSVEENRDGSVKTSDLQFLCTRLDGQDTKVILTLENGISAQYKYTPDGLYYMKEGKLYYKAYAKSYKDKKDGCVVAEGISAVHFPVSKSYEQGKNYLADAVLYTKSSDVSYDYTNTLYAYSKATGEKVLIDKDTYGDDLCSVSVVASLGEDDGSLVIVYTKTDASVQSGKSTGTYGYKLTSLDKVNPAKEVKYSDSSLSSLTVIAIDKVLSSASTMTLYTVDDNGKAKDPVPFKDDNGSISISGNSSTVCGVVDGYVYYLSSNILYRYAIDNSTYVQKVGADKMTMSFVAPELVWVNGGLHCYFFNTDKKDYMYRYDMTNYDKAGHTAELVGQVKAEDAKALGLTE